MKTKSQRPAYSVGMEGQANDRILLVVEDHPGVTSVLFRFLKHHVYRIYLATGPSEAAAIMEGIAVTHMVVDEDFGETEIKGSEFLRLCRKRCPSLRRAVIYTGSAPSSVPRYKEIDAVVSKTATVEELKAELGFLQKK